MKCIQQPRTLERKHVCKNSLSLFVSFNSAILYTTKIVHYISGIYKLWGVCVCVCVCIRGPSCHFLFHVSSLALSDEQPARDPGNEH